MGVMTFSAGLVARFDVGPLSLWRAAAPTLNAYGERVAAAPTSTSLSPVAVHTVTGAELEQLPEADRHRETIRLYTTERLRATEDGNAADRVVYDGSTYRVVVAENYGPQGDVYAALAVLEDTP